MNPRKMRIGMSIRGHGYHPAAWRHPEVAADCTLQVEHYVRSAQTAERGKLDMIFFADGAGIRQGDNPPGSLARTGRDMIELEPTMLLPALAMVTSHIGLVTTASTTYNEPYNLARRFATLDLISKGRAGWNVVASWSEHEAQNFGLETTLNYETRYARSAEFVEVVKGLWDGWDDGALLLDKASGRYFDEAKMHVLNHHGRFFKVRGPLSVACMPQGHPVIVQAGASEQGRELGAATADVIYAINGSLEAARAYYTDVKGRMSIGVQSGVNLPRRNTAFDRLRAYAEAEGRDPAMIGIDTRVSAGHGSEAEWRDEVRAWKALGVTHLTSANYYESGHLHRIAGRTMTDHVAAMKRYWNAVADLL
jgi:FMN-dependent oxidoreductase (nitrilotriacetate monooxygenase family)